MLVRAVSGARGRGFPITRKSITIGLSTNVNDLLVVSTAYFRTVDVELKNYFVTSLDKKKLTMS